MIPYIYSSHAGALIEATVTVCIAPCALSSGAKRRMNHRPETPHATRGAETVRADRESAVNTAKRTENKRITWNIIRESVPAGGGYAIIAVKHGILLMFTNHHVDG